MHLPTLYEYKYIYGNIIICVNFMLEYLYDKWGTLPASPHLSYGLFPLLGHYLYLFVISNLSHWIDVWCQRILSLSVWFWWWQVKFFFHLWLRIPVCLLPEKRVGGGGTDCHKVHKSYICTLHTQFGRNMEDSELICSFLETCFHSRSLKSYINCSLWKLRVPVRYFWKVQ